MKPNFTAVTLLLAVCLSLHSYDSFSQCFPAPVVPLFTPARVSINQNETVTYSISNAIAAYQYEVIDSASNQPLGRSVLAIADGTLSVTTDPFPFPGTFTVFIRATNLLGVTQCIAVSAYGSVVVNPSVLPLKLLQFKGKKQGTGILLEWETANEDRLNRFEIERSATGSLFEDIGQVAATAQANGGKHYTFTDAHPSGSANYYRLKMVDDDGRYTYSNTILFRITSSLTIHVSPNPFTESVSIQVTLEKPQAIYIRLMDAAGALIYTREVKGRQGNNSIVLNDLSAIPKGSYFVQVRNSDNAIQQKIVKINK